MKFSHDLLVLMGTLLFAATASAQLKPNTASLQTHAKPTAAAAQAPEPAGANTANAEKEATAKLAAAGWLVLLDRRDWGRAWETASAVFRTSVPLSAWIEGIPKVREPMGALIEREPAESAYKTTLEGRPDGEYVTVIFLSKFENRELQEVVTTVREADGKWRATGYSTR